MLLFGVTSQLEQFRDLSLVLYEQFHCYQLRASSAIDSCACENQVADMKILWREVLDWPVIEPVTLSMDKLNTHAFPAVAIGNQVGRLV